MKHKIKIQKKGKELKTQHKDYNSLYPPTEATKDKGNQK